MCYDISVFSETMTFNAGADRLFGQFTHSSTRIKISVWWELSDHNQHLRSTQHYKSSSEYGQVTIDSWTWFNKTYVDCLWLCQLFDWFLFYIVYLAFENKSFFPWNFLEFWSLFSEIRSVSSYINDFVFYADFILSMTTLINEVFE